MNLPVDAVEFLDVFIGLFDDANPKVWVGEDKKIKLPMVHVYGFTFEADREKALEYFVERMGKAMQFKEFNKNHIVHFHNIRDVSPVSHMYSVSFYLPEEVAFLKKNINKEGKNDIYDEFEDKSRQKILKKD